MGSPSKGLDSVLLLMVILSLTVLKIFTITHLHNDIDNV